MLVIYNLQPPEKPKPSRASLVNEMKSVQKPKVILTSTSNLPVSQQPSTLKKHPAPQRPPPRKLPQISPRTDSSNPGTGANRTPTINQDGFKPKKPPIKGSALPKIPTVPPQKVLSREVSQISPKSQNILPEDSIMNLTPALPQAILSNQGNISPRQPISPKEKSQVPTRNPLINQQTGELQIRQPTKSRIEIGESPFIADELNFETTEPAKSNKNPLDKSNINTKTNHKKTEDKKF